MSKTISKSIGQGWGRNPIYAALAYDANDKFGGYQIKDVMHNTTYREYFYDTGASIYATASGALALAGTTIGITGVVTVTGNLTITGSITYGSEVVSLNQSLMGTLTVGVDDTGYDVKFFGAGTGKYWLWDESANGVVLVGTFTETGNMAVTGSFTLTGAATVSTTLNVTGATTVAALTIVGAVSITGAVTIVGANTLLFRDAELNIYSSTNGTLNINADTILALAATDITLGGIVGITGATTITGTMTLDGDITVSGAHTFTSGTGAITLSGAMAATTALTFSPAAAGTFLAFVLATEWVSGTLITAGCASGTTFSDDVIGMLLDLGTNVTMTTHKDVTGYQVKLPALTQANNNTTTIIGFDLPTAGALNQSAAGAIVWRGLNIQMPTTAETTGTTTAHGIYITNGTITSGTQIGIYIGACTIGVNFGSSVTGISMTGAYTTGISMTGTYSTAGILISTTLAAIDDHAISSTVSSNATSGELIANEFVATLSGIGGTGFGLKSLLDVNARLGSYANAIYGFIDFSGGSISGLGSAICAEMLMGAAMNATGSYGVLEIELGIPESWTAVQELSLIYMQVYGGNSTALGLFNHSANLMSIVGLGAADTTHIFHTIASGTGTHGLRIEVDGVGYDILLKATGA